MTKIFKIVDQAEWNRAETRGQFEGAEIDLKDGFIHFSAIGQVEQTAKLHFSGRKNLLLVAVETDRFGDELKWELSRGGEKFPHLYAPLEISAVSWVKEIQLNSLGEFDFSFLHQP